MGKNIATNRKALRDYSVIETLECGIELKGSEVKSIREGKVTLEDSFARVEKDEVMLYNCHISPYAQASYLNVEPTRRRKLLLHRKQISKLEGQTVRKGVTLVPLKFYFNERGFVKVELALCQGKKLYDRRQDIKERELGLKVRRVMKNRRSR